MKTVGFHTFGCKLNYSETSSISRIFKENGYKNKSIYNNPDNIVINTCSVTENADKKCKDLIKKIKKHSPDSIVTIVGCFAQLKPDTIKNIKGVDKVIGTKEKFNFDSYINNKSIIHSEISQSKEFNSTFSVDDRTRSFLKVQDGCNYGCSFCTIPLARGKSRSAEPNEVLSKINDLINKGSKEIILSGINIGDYGIMDGKRKNNFFSLLKYIENETDDVRFRISSIEPNLLNDDIIELVAHSNKFVNHFHIPLQSGSNNILKKMSRRYSIELYHDRINKIKKLMPNACIGADVIVGFPGETDNEFDKTLKFIKRLDISYLHVFPYSERNNTRALKIIDVVPQVKRSERSKILRELSEKKKRKFYDSNLNLSKEVLFEDKVKEGYVFGYTDNYIKTKVKFKEDYIGKIFRTKLKRIDKDFTAIGII
ncbi:MAG: tRNA (N(6)-L-threonylcarbamoyladenosine(37)-C(2))-methylthiotransferase MtaB [Cytophagales bacterium]|nr:MAG: tRNA (N(6)-L-threonylcarbamoyladenosine(37)-C(2))-methylthiotransferase MtaB [Rhodothermaeota bacterium MED-G19]